MLNGVKFMNISMRAAKPIRRIGVGFKGEPHRNLLNHRDVIEHILNDIRFLKISWIAMAG
jgi:hypothetical protein